jgi:hypothetical protein
VTELPFSKDTREFIRLLAIHKVRYILVGGMAVIYHGYPRLTGDYDFFVDATRANAGRLFSALKEFWGGSIPFVDRVEDLLQKGVIIQFGTRPNRIDLINSITGVSFSEAWKNRVQEGMKIEGQMYPIDIIGLDELIKNKEALVRYRDLDDLRFLVAAAARQSSKKRTC